MADEFTDIEESLVRRVSSDLRAEAHFWRHNADPKEPETADELEADAARYDVIADKIHAYRVRRVALRKDV